MPNLSLQDQATEFLLYSAPNGETKVEVLLRNETIWLTQERMAKLFGVQRPAITKHLKNIFETGELDDKLVCSVLEQTTEHGAMAGKTQTQQVKYYNLDAVISVGYRVNSLQATQFRIWATQLSAVINTCHRHPARSRGMTSMDAPPSSTRAALRNTVILRTVAGSMDSATSRGMTSMDAPPSSTRVAVILRAVRLPNDSSRVCLYFSQPKKRHFIYRRYQQLGTAYV